MVLDRAAFEQLTGNLPLVKFALLTERIVNVVFVEWLHRLADHMPYLLSE